MPITIVNFFMMKHLLMLFKSFLHFFIFSHFMPNFKEKNILCFYMQNIMGEIEKTVEKILENKYKDSLKIIRMSKTSRELLEELKKECPHVPEKEIISLFKSVAAGTKMVDSAIIAAAHNMEYNATHPSKKEKTWLDDLFTKEARKIISPKELMKDKKLYKEFIDYISKLEEKYDNEDPPDIAIFRRRVTAFLKERVKKK
ncbi:MAG: hypothetical protein DRN29_04950 [Thermoplasmata archaeon]|nr:MAG: hypothetical protein DRN29_04950 [Thermoplasmata archaeon]